ncbi:hypothetical protein BV25DRAFT_1837513 [Artomyces pyxidatus]|uniref:Uncharacterized protein n=1 Tax=Artomyces pyxidatus TaxID=48021 RepID=A0ACB8T5W3_9AGAM|nr:hypothetical protein BV25DRAFT_1837513 [Artomyces pyxidatus]
MGVSGLWDLSSHPQILHPAGQSRSLDHLAVVDGFESNKSGKRAYRVGIDASLWYAHAVFSKGGENPELRMLFFRLRNLAELPVLPLFVFDGRERPQVKRGSKKGKAGSHMLTAGLKKLLDIFGMEWRMAVGEAEAELAHLNRLGVIDAVLTDDVDALVFGAVTIIRNRSASLTGNKSNPALDSEGKKSKDRVMIYTADAIKNHPSIQLTRGGLILIALLSGGDYHDGVPKFGPGTAHALARCGFGDKLLSIFQQRNGRDIRPLLSHWRDSVREELRSNASGYNTKKLPSLSLPPDFPSMDVMENYVSPKTGATARGGGQGGGALRDNGDMSLPRLAAFCETHFGEWGFESMIIKRFRSLIWEGAIMRLLRRAALEADEKEKTKRINAGIEDWTIRGLLKPTRAEGVGMTESFVKQFLTKKDSDRYADVFVNRGPAPPVPRVQDKNVFEMKIVSLRQDVKTDRLPEYRVELCPSLLVSLTRSGIQGKRTQVAVQATQSIHDDIFDVNFAAGSQRKTKTPTKPPPEPDSRLRMWLPASMMQQVFPGLVEDFVAAEAAKKAKGKGKKKATQSTEPGSSPAGKGKGRARAQLMSDSDDDEGFDDHFTPGMPAGSSQRMAPSGTIVHNTHVDPLLFVGVYGPSTLTPFHFTFPNPDDPDMVFLEDGLFLPGASQTAVSTGTSTVRPRVPSNPSVSALAVSRPGHPTPEPRSTLTNAMGTGFPRSDMESDLPRNAGLHGRRSNGSSVGGRAPRPAPVARETDEAMFGLGLGSDDDELPINLPLTGRSLADKRFYDHLFDQAMGGGGKRQPKPKPKPRARPVKRPHPTAAGMSGPAIPTPTQAPSSQAQSERPSKRQRVEPPSGRERPVLPVRNERSDSIISRESATDAEIIEIFSDSEDRRPSSRSNVLRSFNYSAPVPSSSISQPKKRYYPEPFSSQDSGLLSEASIIVDLT